jgi:hypothetical protein
VKELLLLPFFPLFLTLGVVADPECGPNTVDLTDTHSESKTFMK